MLGFGGRGCGLNNATVKERREPKRLEENKPEVSKIEDNIKFYTENIQTTKASESVSSIRSAHKPTWFSTVEKPPTGKYDGK